MNLLFSSTGTRLSSTRNMSRSPFHFAFSWGTAPSERETKINGKKVHALLKCHTFHTGSRGRMEDARSVEVDQKKNQQMAFAMPKLERKPPRKKRAAKKVYAPPALYLVDSPRQISSQPSLLVTVSRFHMSGLLAMSLMNSIVLTSVPTLIVLPGRDFVYRTCVRTALAT